MLDTINTNNNNVALTKIFTIIIVFIPFIIPWILIINEGSIKIVFGPNMFLCEKGL